MRDDVGMDLHGLLRFEPEEGRIWLKDYRMVMFSACAIGVLRRELVQTLGWDQARGALKRFGHAAGLADGIALAERFPAATELEQLRLGPALHGLEGIANVVRIPEATEIDLARGILHVEGYWENSFEAEQHLQDFGKSDEPVCWTLVGYATGHASAAAGKRTIVVETECRAMGHDRCRFVSDYAENLPEQATREELDYERHNLPDKLQELVERVKQQTRSLKQRERRIHSLESELARYRPSDDTIGEDPEFQAALSTARTVAPVDATVLILGESGTGKELVARFVHDQSLRRTGEFVAVNCSALPENLQEAELFGYAKGAFTGATTANAGVFEAANGGTLFLDEIGDLSLTAQTKILRALQEREIKRIGETRTRKVDIRIIAATHRDLDAMVREKTFREDLYYRLSVIKIELPPLRERGNDRFLLAEHFVGTFSAKMSRPARELGQDAYDAIAGYGWPGNVRELANAIERAVILSPGETIGAEHLPKEVGPGSASDARARFAADATVTRELESIEDEGERLTRALDIASGNRDRAAAMLGISRTTLWRRMKGQGLLG